MRWDQTCKRAGQTEESKRATSCSSTGAFPTPWRGVSWGQTQLSCRASYSSCPGHHSLVFLSVTRGWVTFTLWEQQPLGESSKWVLSSLTGSKELCRQRPTFPSPPCSAQTIPTAEVLLSATCVLFSKAQGAGHQGKLLRHRRQKCLWLAKFPLAESYQERLSLPQSLQYLEQGNNLL